MIESEKHKKASNKTIGDYIKQIAAYTFLISCFAIGIAVAGAFWSSTVSQLNNQLAESRAELNRSTEELTQLKSDYLSYKVNHVNSKETVKESIPIQNDTINKSVVKNEIASVDAGKSRTFFNGDLTISLVASNFGGDPLRYRVLANISSPSGKVVKIVNEDPGFMISYNNGIKFNITILEVEGYSAKFQVSRD